MNGGGLNAFNIFPGEVAYTKKATYINVAFFKI